MANDVRLQPVLPPVRPSSSVAASQGEARTFHSIGRPPPEGAQPTQGAAVGRQELSELAEELSELAQVVRRELDFSVDEDSGRTVIRVVDSSRSAPPASVGSAAVATASKPRRARSLANPARRTLPS